MKFYLFNLIDFVGEDKFDEMTDKAMDMSDEKRIKYFTEEVQKEYDPFDYSTLQVYSVPNRGVYYARIKDAAPGGILHINSGYVVLLKFDEDTSEIMNNDKFKELLDKDYGHCYISLDISGNVVSFLVDDLTPTWVNAPNQVDFFLLGDYQIKGKFVYRKYDEEPKASVATCNNCSCQNDNDSIIPNSFGTRVVVNTSHNNQTSQPQKPFDTSWIGDAPIVIGMDGECIETFYGDDSILIDNDFEAFSIEPLSAVGCSRYSSYINSYIKAKPLDDKFGENTPLENIRIIVDVEDSGAVVLSYDDFVEWTKDRWNSPYNYYGDVESWDTRNEKKNRQLLLDAFKNRRFNDLETMMRSCGEDEGVGVYCGVFEYLGEFKV